MHLNQQYTFYCMHNNYPGEISIMKYDFTLELTLPINEAARLIHLELEKRRFKLVSIMDIEDLIGREYNPEIHPYKLLFVTHPSASYLALKENPSMGMLLIWPMAIYTQNDRTLAGFIRPRIMEQHFETDTLRQGSILIERKLTEVMQSVQTRSSSVAHAHQQ